jgi:hypothetical protein
MSSRPPLSGPQAKRGARLLAPLLFIALLAAALYWPAAVASPPFIVLQTLFRQVMYPLLTGEQSQQPFAHSAGIYFLIITPATIALVVLLHRRMMMVLPASTYIGRAGRVLGLMVLAMVLLNSGVQGGLGIPLALAYAALLFVLTWEAQLFAWGRRIVEAVVWVGLGFLISSGVVLPFAVGETRFDLQRLHGIYGYLWLSAVAAYLVAHITFYEAKWETSLRNWGYVAAIILSAGLLTGVARLHGGGETSASGLWPHVCTGAAAVLAVAVHIGQSWRKRGLTARRGEAHGSGVFVLACLTAGLVLPLLPATLGRVDARTTQDATVGASLLASPEMGITASGPAGAGLPPALVSVRASAISCGKNGGCHVDTQAQWQRSAHRFSANPAYRRTVQLLIQQGGIEQARLCAGCHDPVPLLTGQIVPGSNYPFDDSEGVTCVVCHSMHPGADAKNGRYAVEPSSLFNDSVKDPFTAYMMIELYRGEHRGEFLGPALTDNSICAPCHNLTTAHLVLRRTFEEWREGPVGPGSSDPQSCTSCHMPLVGDTYLGFFKLHDHRMPASNVALAGLRRESPEAERAFIAGALDLQFSIAPRTAAGFAMTVHLTNVGGGHAFPTAPRDLLDYWFEVQFEGDGVDPAWHRLDATGLFAEQLVADDGHALLQHEIWRAVDKRGPEAIAPRESREYAFPLPPPPPGVERVTLRLMHRRYQDAFLGFLGAGKGDLYTDALEVLRRTAAWSPDAQIADRELTARNE